MFNNKILMRTSHNFESKTSQMSSIETEVEFKSRIFAKTLTEAVHNVANEPSLGFYRIEEHVHKSNQNLINKNYDQIELSERIKGLSFDLDYSKEAVLKISNSKDTFDSIYNISADCLFKARELALMLNVQPQIVVSATVDNINTGIIKNQLKPKQPLESKKESFVSGILSSVKGAKPFRTLSMSVSENLSQETTKPQRSQTMLLSDTIKELNESEVVQTKQILNEESQEELHVTVNKSSDASSTSIEKIDEDNSESIEEIKVNEEKSNQADKFNNSNLQNELKVETTQDSIDVGVLNQSNLELTQSTEKSIQEPDKILENLTNQERNETDSYLETTEITQLREKPILETPEEVETQIENLAETEHENESQKNNERRETESKQDD